MNIESPQKGVMLGIGLNYIRFAIEEPHLFRFLFQSNFFNGTTLLEMIDAEELAPVLLAMQGAVGGSIEQVKEIFLTVFLFAHGYASIIANNSLEYDEELIKSHLERAYKRGNISNTGGNKMRKLYEKNELTFAIVWIVIYCVLQSLANPLNEKIGVEYSASAIFSILQSVILLVFIRKNNLLKRYGLCKSPISASRFLFYIPLIILATRNFWNGAAFNLNLAGTVCYIACMLWVGFLEEVIFRGLLFKAIAKDNVKTCNYHFKCYIWFGTFIKLGKWQWCGNSRKLTSSYRGDCDWFSVCHSLLSWR